MSTSDQVFVPRAKDSDPGLDAFSGAVAAGISSIAVFVAHRSRLFTEGIAAILGQSSDFRLIGMAHDPPAILDSSAKLEPCIVLLDCVLVGEDPTLLRTLAADANRRVILITARPDDRRILEAVRLGIRGVLLESMGARLLTTCIRKVAAGEEWIEQGSAGRLLHQFAHQGTGTDTFSLSRREIQIVQGIARHLSNREIAGELFISTATVKSHVHSIFRKLGATTRDEVVSIARSRNLV